MANVIKTVMTYPLNGSTRDFNIPFEYLARKFVQVTLLGVDRKVLSLNTDYRFSTKTTITTTQAWGPAQGYQQIEIRRYTSATERLVDFTDGSILRAYDLNIAQIQTMHVAEEARDLTADTIGVNNEGHLDARGRRIVNLGNAVNDRDAVPFGQLKTMNQNAWDAQNKAQQFRNEAQTFRNQAETFKNETNNLKNAAAASQNAAKTSETNAKASENAAAASKGAAATSQAAAKTSETNAKNSENAARGQADLAKKWATNPRNQKVDATEYSAKHYAEVAKEESAKLGNWNALAGTVESVSGTDVKFKNRVGLKEINMENAFLNKNRLRLQSQNDSSKYIDTFCWNDAANRKVVMEWGSNVGQGYLAYLQKVTDTKAEYQVNGDITANQVCKAGQRFYTQSTLGSGGLASQLGDSAPYSHSLPGNQDGNVYYPMIKQYGRRSTGYPTSFSMGLTSMGSNAFHKLFIQMNGDANKAASWSFDMTTGYFNTKGLRADAQIQSVGNGANFLLQTAGNVENQASYVLGQAGGNNWYIGKGGADNNITLHSYKLNTNIVLRSDVVAINKPLLVGGNGKMAGDGNIYGSKWGNRYLDAFLNDTYVKKTKNWTRVWAGTAGGNTQTGTLPQDLRFRNVWLVMADGYRNFIRFGPDGLYFLSSYGGWIKLQLHSSGKILKNVQDKTSVLREIWVENE